MNIVRRIAAALLLTVLFGTNCVADTTSVAADNPAPSGSATTRVVSSGSAGSQMPGADLVLGAQLAIASLVFGVVVLALQTFLLVRSKARPESVGRILGLTMVIIATLFVVVAGFSAQQMAPALGLFGTVAGYLIGQGDPMNARNAEK